MSNNTEEWKSGPDELMPADSFYSNQLDMPVKLRDSELNQKKYPIMSIYSAFKQTVDKRPDHNALAFKLNNEYCYLTYNQYWQKCKTAAKSFIKVRKIYYSFDLNKAFNSLCNYYLFKSWAYNQAKSFQLLDLIHLNGLSLI